MVRTVLIILINGLCQDDEVVWYSLNSNNANILPIFNRSLSCTASNSPQSSVFFAVNKVVANNARRFIAGMFWIVLSCSTWLFCFSRLHIIHNAQSLHCLLIGLYRPPENNSTDLQSKHLDTRSGCRLPCTPPVDWWWMPQWNRSTSLRLWWRPVPSRSDWSLSTGLRHRRTVRSRWTERGRCTGRSTYWLGKQATLKHNTALVQHFTKQCRWPESNSIPI